jgi:hypothetical protein
VNREYVCCCCQQHFNKIPEEKTEQILDTSAIANISLGDGDTSIGDSSFCEKLNFSIGDKINPGTDFGEPEIVVPKKSENRFNTLNSDIGQQVIKEDSEESKSDVEGQTQVETASKRIYAKSKTSKFNLSPLNCDSKDNLRKCLEYSPSPTGVDSNVENSTSPHRLSYRTAARDNKSPPRFKKDAQPKPHEISTPGKSEIDEQKAQTRPRFSQQLPGKELLRIPENSIPENINN